MNDIDLFGGDAGPALDPLAAVPFQIDPEFQALIPALSFDERQLLEENLLRDGCRDPLTTWQGVLVDGHHRYAICAKHGLPFQTIELSLPDRAAALAWMIANQLGRRNLTPEVASYLRGKRYELEKQSHGGLRPLASVQNEQLPTAERLAATYDVSSITIRRDADFAKAVDVIGEKSERLKDEILSGRSPMSKPDVIRLSKQPALLNQAVADKTTAGDVFALLIEKSKEERRSDLIKRIDYLISELGTKLQPSALQSWKLTPLEYGERFHTKVTQPSEKGDRPLPELTGLLHKENIQRIADFCRGFQAREAKIKTLGKNV